MAKVSQHKTQLEMDLAQTKEKTEDFRNKNTLLAGELEQERQRIANLERKLAISNSSLEQSDQRNEQRTSELAQANQRNERLINNLKQEREDKANLERKLVNLNSPAYQTILEAIYLKNSAKTDEQKRKCLEKLKETSISLGREYQPREYQRQEISPDYSRRDYQEAYLLRYFLPYSQPVPYLLNHLMLQKDFPYQLPEDGTLTASFFGCGPGPELYGLTNYLGAPQSGVDISAAMLDIAPWEHGRKIVFEHLLTSPEIHEFKSNLVGNARDFLPNDSEQWVSNSDLIVIQHCLNEKHNALNEQLLENLKQIVQKMKPGAVMLIIERARYREVKELLGKFGHFCYKSKDKFSNIEYETEIENRDGVDLKPILQVIPKELRDGFFGKSSLNSVNPVRFIWMAVLKKH